MSPPSSRRDRADVGDEAGVFGVDNTEKLANVAIARLLPLLLVAVADARNAMGEHEVVRAVQGLACFSMNLLVGAEKSRRMRKIAATFELIRRQSRSCLRACDMLRSSRRDSSPGCSQISFQACELSGLFYLYV